MHISTLLRLIESPGDSLSTQTFILDRNVSYYLKVVLAHVPTEFSHTIPTAIKMHQWK